MYKALAEIPVDACFGAAFAVVLKAWAGLHTTLPVMDGMFSLLTVDVTELGFAVDRVAPNGESSLALGLLFVGLLL